LEEISMDKFYIELNGVANIKMLMDELVANAQNNEGVMVYADKIYKQLDILERYMLAVADAARRSERPPFWHDVRDNKDKYPLNKERR
jgi:hypothetical protein